jgi:hypothetical protein
MPAEPRSRRSALLVVGTLAAAAASIVATLMIPPVVGLADNGDFYRVEVPAGLDSLERTRENRYFFWMQPRFLYVEPKTDPSGFRTSETLLVKIAVEAGKVFSGAELFDVRLLGAVHAAILLAALGMLVASARGLAAPAQALLGALAVFFFTDVGYVAPFQSLYSQTASFLFLLVTAAIVALAIARGRLAGAWLPVYFLCAAVFVCSKPQESVQAVLLAPLGVRLAWSGPRRARVAAVLMAAALLALGGRYYQSAQSSTGWITRYNLLFLKILPTSPDPGGDLAELGLDPSLARYSGVTAWVADSPARIPEVREFLDPRAGKTSPRMLFVRHPKRLLEHVEKAAESSYVLQPGDLGNFSRGSGAPPLAVARGAWSSLRVHLSGWIVPVILLAGTFLAAAFSYRRATARGRLFREALAVLVAMTVGAFIVAAFGDGLEIERHLYSFQAMCDLILLADAVWIVQLAASHRAPAEAP